MLIDASVARAIARSDMPQSEVGESWLVRILSACSCSKWYMSQAFMSRGFRHSLKSFSPGSFYFVRHCFY